MEEVRSAITTDIEIAVATGGSLVHENSELVNLSGYVELVVSPVASGKRTALFLVQSQFFLVCLKIIFIRI